MRSARATACLLLAALTACSAPQDELEAPRAGDPERGRAALAAFECGACHVIPGVRGPRSHVGPPLAGFAHSVYIAGRFPNTPEVLARWVRDAPALAPETAMPAVTMSEAQAHDIAAYLRTLD
jgi:mono/diheme cytochrome c family protein